MKLYKIRSMKGDHGVSVFPPGPVPEGTADAYVNPSWQPTLEQMVNMIMLKGYTDHEARTALDAWAYHAKVDLNQARDGVSRFCQMCTEEIPVKDFPEQPMAWSVVIFVAVIVAVILGLYLWVTLDKEIDVTFATHPWAYCMTYEERIWAGEIWGVTGKRTGIYEQSIFWGGAVIGSERDLGGDRGKDWIAFKPNMMVLEGRHPLFYHVYRFTGFDVRFCGLLENAGWGLYKLRSGGSDSDRPRGPWTRPGGRWGTAEYQGCWGLWWWL